MPLQNDTRRGETMMIQFWCRLSEQTACLDKIGPEKLILSIICWLRFHRNYMDLESPRSDSISHWSQSGQGKQSYPAGAWFWVAFFKGQYPGKFANHKSCKLGFGCRLNFCLWEIDTLDTLHSAVWAVKYSWRVIDTHQMLHIQVETGAWTAAELSALQTKCKKQTRKMQVAAHAQTREFITES